MGRPTATASSGVSTTLEAPVSTSMGMRLPLISTRTLKSPSRARATSTAGPPLWLSGTA